MKATIAGTAAVLAVALSALQNTLGFSTVSAPAQQKFSKLKPAFPVNINPVQAGGWYNIVKAAATESPKDELVKLIIDGLKEGDSKDNNRVETKSNTKAEQVEALVAVLYAQGKGFDANHAHGNWSPVYSKQGSKSPKFQKVVAKKEKAGKSEEMFDTTSMTFSGTAGILKKGELGSVVKVRIFHF